LNTPKTRISRSVGKSSRRTAFVREIAQEVVGLAPYERRIIELLRNAQDKRARKLAKKRVCLSNPYANISTASHSWWTRFVLFEVEVFESERYCWGGEN
jgi:hypothetical protein